MIRKNVLALATAMVLALAPTMVSCAQEDPMGEVWAEGGLSTPFGTVAPAVASAVAVAAILGVVVAVTAGNNNSASTTAATASTAP